MRKLSVVIYLTFFTYSLLVAQNFSISYEIGFSDVAFVKENPFGFTTEYNSKAGNTIYVLGEWPTKIQQLTFLTGLNFGKYQLEEKIRGLVFLDDINMMTGATRTGTLEREITLQFIGIPTLLRLKKDWKRIQGFVTGGLVFRRLQSLSSKQSITYTDGEIEPLNATNDITAFDFSFYTNVGCRKRLNERLSLFLLASVNLDLHNGKKENEQVLFGSGNIIHPGISVGVGYDL